MTPQRSTLVLFIGAMFFLVGCVGFRPKEGVHVHIQDGDASARAHEPVPTLVDQSALTNMFQTEMSAAAKAFAAPETIDEFSRPTQLGYRLGPGDKFAFLVRGRPDISREDIIVSPDGEVALPRVGMMSVFGKTIGEVTATLNERLKTYYDEPDVTLVMQYFNNNKVFVLGRVANPGAVHFTGRGTLLEALSLSGGLPVDTARSFLTRCMIVRGRDMVIWIDLKELLENGNMALNAGLQNGDVVFIPQSEDQMAYVMGMVQMPGVMLLRNTMTVLDAIMQSGGLARDGNPDAIFLVRQHEGKGLVERIDLAAMVEKGDLRKNFVLQDGDILYVDERGASKFNYYLSNLLPSMDVIDFSIRTAESFGAMAELRKKLWGQEGFVSQGR